jgi:hypothetical protein
MAAISIDLLLAALLSAGHAPPTSDAFAPGRTAWVFATIGHSEWCPPGDVRLDLTTGRYTLTPRSARRACNQTGRDRPAVAGRLGPAGLGAIRSAYRRVLEEGMLRPSCRNGMRPDRIVVMNGGTPILVMATGAAARSAPDDASCWSDAADSLERALDDAFRFAHGR